MKQFKITYFRHNPQLQSGGYERTEIVKAKTMKNAENNAWKKCAKCCYGSMTVEFVEEI